MSDDDTPVRAPSNNIMKDWELRAVFARKLGISTRTVWEYEREPDGLPHAYFGGKDHVFLPGAREWMLRRVKIANPTRPPRRPRKPKPEPKRRKRARAPATLREASQ